MLSGRPSFTQPDRPWSDSPDARGHGRQAHSQLAIAPDVPQRTRPGKVPDRTRDPAERHGATIPTRRVIGGNVCDDSAVHAAGSSSRASTRPQPATRGACVQMACGCDSAGLSAATTTRCGRTNSSQRFAGHSRDASRTEQTNLAAFRQSLPEREIVAAGVDGRRRGPAGGRSSNRAARPRKSNRGCRATRRSAARGRRPRRDCPSCTSGAHDVRRRHDLLRRDRGTHRCLRRVEVLAAKVVAQAIACGVRQARVR